MPQEYNPSASNGQDRPDETPLPSHIAGSGTLDRLADTARGYAQAAASENTLKAYKADWAHFARWCRMKGTDPLPPSPQIVGLYLADLASPGDKAPALSPATIDRRLSGLCWMYAQRGLVLDRRDRHVASVLAGIKRKHARPPEQKEAILPEAPRRKPLIPGRLSGTPVSRVRPNSRRRSDALRRHLVRSLPRAGPLPHPNRSKTGSAVP